MPKLSVVVPVYNVAPYVRECLESVTRYPGTDLEVIVVDDCSPDHSAAIVAEFVARDRRVQLLTTPENVGLGPARNIGLARASGDYVMFLDSDDALTKGALEAIQRRVAETSSDIIVFDYERLYWNNRRQRNVMSQLFREAPEIFTLGDYPDLLDLLNVAWNKVYRHEFLVDSGVTFPAGYYEDIPFTYLILPFAKSISMLDRVCLSYRQRRDGSILRTTSERHFEILQQFDLLFERLAQHGDLSHWAGDFWDRCAGHALTVLEHGGRRLPTSSRRRFFLHASRTLARHLPDGHDPSTGDAKLLLNGQYAAYISTTAAKETRTRLQQRAVDIWHNEPVQLAAYRATRRLPLNDELAVFSCLWERAPSGNPKAIFDAVRLLSPEIRCVWVVRRSMAALVPDDIEVVHPGSRRHIQTMARARFFVNDVNFPNWWNKRSGQVFLQTQHGTPLKFMGLDLQRYPAAAKNMSFRSLMKRVDKWDYNLSSNSYSSEVWRRAFPSDHETLEYGYPRNDVLINITNEESRQARKRVGVPIDRKTILYAPTHRDNASDLELRLDGARLVANLDEPVTLLLRGHYFYRDSDAALELEDAGIIVDATRYPTIEDLYLASDVLITDYSSAMFDYANLSRPIIIYAYDWEEYQSTRGVYFDVTAEPPGPVATDMDRLVEILQGREYDTAAAASHLRRFQSTFCEFDDGKAAERVVRRVFLGEAVDPPEPVWGTPAPLSTWTSDRSG